jgi:hypothetical protein
MVQSRMSHICASLPDSGRHEPLFGALYQGTASSRGEKAAAERSPRCRRPQRRPNAAASLDSTPDASFSGSIPDAASKRSCKTGLVDYRPEVVNSARSSFRRGSSCRSGCGTRVMSTNSLVAWRCWANSIGLPDGFRRHIEILYSLLNCRGYSMCEPQPCSGCSTTCGKGRNRP